jgi:hypothetical protein
LVFAALRLDDLVVQRKSPACSEPCRFSFSHPVISYSCNMIRGNGAVIDSESDNNFYQVFQFLVMFSAFLSFDI